MLTTNSQSEDDCWFVGSTRRLFVASVLSSRSSRCLNALFLLPLRLNRVVITSLCLHKPPLDLSFQLSTQTEGSYAALVLRHSSPVSDWSH